MATILTSSADPGSLVTWNVPGGATLPRTRIPRGERVYRGSQVIAIKDAANISVWTLTATLPRNFCYKLVEMRVRGDFTSAAEAIDIEPGAKATLTDDVASDSFDLVLPSQLTGEADPAAKGYRWSATGLIWTFGMEAASLPATFLKAQAADATVIVNWIDQSSDASATYTLFWYIRLFVFDVDQLNEFGVHVPTPIWPG